VKFTLPGFGPKGLVGLDIGSSSIKAVEVVRRDKSGDFDLISLGTAALPPEAIVQGAFLNANAITDSIREAVERGKLRSKQVAVAVSGHSVIVKKVSLPAMSAEELEDQIRFEAEQYIPFDVNEVNLDFQILSQGAADGQMDVVLVAAKKDLIDDYVQVITEAGLTPVVIDVAAFAVENAFEVNYHPVPDEVVALVNIGAQVVNINVLSGGAPLFTRDVTTAGNQYTEEIQKAMSVSFDEAERIKLGRAGDEQAVVPREVEAATRGVNETIVGEIARSLDFFAATTTDVRVQKVYLAGGASRASGLLDAFRQRTGLPVELLNPLARMRPNTRFEPERLAAMAPSLSVGVGLAMRRLEI
jgi:type IV pilus assembly protein PilM